MPRALPLATYEATYHHWHCLPPHADTYDRCTAVCSSFFFLASMPSLTFFPYPLILSITALYRNASPTLRSSKEVIPQNRVPVLTGLFDILFLFFTTLQKNDPTLLPRTLSQKSWVQVLKGLIYLFPFRLRLVLSPLHRYQETHV